ncbi:MAG TPA: hypothetical protein VH227_04170 [Candidatus Udaeobacter sp.]|jgi:hypothetical protein|nr:hypothetical protein [Candidatus Udaeobacter sp.]
MEQLDFDECRHLNRLTEEINCGPPGGKQVSGHWFGSQPARERFRVPVIDWFSGATSAKQKAREAEYRY